MRSLAKELIPHAPKLGLYVAPHIPTDKLDNAIKDYAPDVQIPEVLALYDGTLLGSAKDGVVFCKERLVFQNTDLQAPQEIRYDDIVRVNARKKLLRGTKVYLDVNRGRATTEVVIDFSARDGAAEHVASFLGEAMLKDVDFGREQADPAPPGRQDPTTDRHAVEDALDRLQKAGNLTREDKYRMLEALDQRA
ncbi:MAG: hypothetical protein JJ896_13420 [Rhodothermales bacterium]|nr:hypothetical protein [Rhodothermales bacterium]MBO6780647.1 hypothetical protein [Rhodothermales bacterium]